jgi:hypothetical protein
LDVETPATDDILWFDFLRLVIWFGWETDEVGMVHYDFNTYLFLPTFLIDVVKF